jgi:hypothetical protein
MLVFLLFSTLALINLSEPKYTQVILPDTQYYSGWFPSSFDQQATWIRNSKDLINIDFVTHVGDIVDDGNKEYMWLNAVHSFKIIQKSGIKFGIAPGNHDVSNGTYSKYHSHFDQFIINDYSYYMPGASENNYQFVTRGTRTFLMINYAYDHSIETYDWIEQILSENPEKYAILNSHAILSDCSDYLSSSRIQEIAYNNCNVVLLVNGHYAMCTGENRMMLQNSCDESTFFIVQDYQGRPDGGGSWLRYYTFDYKGAWNVCVYTYNVRKNEYEEDDNSYFSFTLKNGDYGDGCDVPTLFDTSETMMSFSIISMYFYSAVIILCIVA